MAACWDADRSAPTAAAPGGTSAPASECITADRRGRVRARSGNLARVELDPVADVWHLPIVGFEVLEVWFSGQVYVIAYGEDGEARKAKPASRAQIALGGSFTLRSADGTEQHLNAEAPWETLTPLLSLRHASIATAFANRNAVLQITFGDGSALSAQSDPQYENWEASGPGFRIIAPPGGGEPVIWS